MRLIFQLVFVFLTFSAALLSQDREILTIDEAVRLAIDNNPELRILRYEQQKYDGAVTLAGTIPNPEIAFYRESLSGNRISFSEWTISGNVPLNFLWERWSGIETAHANSEAAKKLSERRLSEIVVAVKSAFVRYHYKKQILEKQEKSLKLLAEIQKSALARTEEGDISGYDQQRIQLEYLMYKRKETESKTELQNARKELMLLMMPKEAAPPSQTGFVPIEFTRTANLQSLIEYAKENRPDVQAANYYQQSRSAQISHKQLKIIPEITLTLGYKSQSDNLKGAVVGFGMGIPFFDRKQAELTIAEAELQKAHTEVQSKKQSVELEILNTYTNLVSYAEQLEEVRAFTSQSTENLIQSAEYAYLEGEMSLVELLDALRAYTEAILLQHELSIQFHINYFQFELAIGKEIQQ